MAREPRDLHDWALEIRVVLITLTILWLGFQWLTRPTEPDATPATHSESIP